MELLCYIVDRASEVFTVFAAILFYFRSLQTKYEKNKVFVATIFYTAARLGYYYLGIGYRPYFSVISSLVFLLIVFNGRPRELLLCALLPVVIDGISDFLVMSVMLFIPSVSIDTLFAIGWQRIVFNVAAKALFFAVLLNLAMKFHLYSTMRFRSFIFMLSVLIGCWVLLVGIFHNSAIDFVMQPMLSLLGSGSLLLIVMSTLFLYRRMSEQEMEITRIALENKVAELTSRHGAHIDRTYREMASIRHDFINHLIAIHGFAEKNDMEGLLTYTQSLSDIAMSTKEMVKNPVADALLRACVERAKVDGVSFVHSFVMPHEMPISDVDLCIIMSNLLDNAFEAACSVADPAEREVAITSAVQGPSWIITVDNSTDDPRSFEQTGALQTTKRAISNKIHGIGTKQVLAVASSTGGYVTFTQRNKRFKAVVVLLHQGEK